jgi:hypothetical protein
MSGLRDGTSPVADAEVEQVLLMMRAYGHPLGPSGVLLGTAVVTKANERRVRLVMDEMEKRGLIRVKHAARNADQDEIYEVVTDG